MYVYSLLYCVWSENKLLLLMYYLSGVIKSCVMSRKFLTQFNNHVVIRRLYAFAKDKFLISDIL